MFISTLILAAAISPGGQQAQPISCPITGEPVVKGMKLTEYNGVRFTYCCTGCDAQFEKNPQAALDKAAKGGNVIGVFLFDPVSLKRMEAEKAMGGSRDYKGVRFYFESENDKTSFDRDPAKFGTLPKKEALFCAVSNKAVTSYGKASGYADYNGARYYFCCPGCDGPFAKDPAKYADLAKGYVKTPTSMTAEKPAQEGHTGGN